MDAIRAEHCTAAGAIKLALARWHAQIVTEDWIRGAGRRSRCQLGKRGVEGIGEDGGHIQVIQFSMAMTGALFV
jgi:hypothetical protein